MRDLIRVALSDNGEEIFVYDGTDDLVMIRPVSDPGTVADYVRNTIMDTVESE